MEIKNIPLLDHRINEYLLVLSPHEELYHKIQLIKEEFGKKYETSVSKHTKPHITLVNFVNWDMMEDKLIHRLQAVSMGITPFKVELKDYGSFPTHTIFINVITKLPIQDLVRNLKEARRLMKLNNENKPHFIEEPHLTICRKLKPWQYEQGWLDYSNRHFTGRFIAESMLLLKRPAGTKERFQIAMRFEFMNLPVATKQGSLFA